MGLESHSMPKIVTGDFGYTLDDVPHLSDYLPHLPVCIFSLSLCLSLYIYMYMNKYTFLSFVIKSELCPATARNSRFIGLDRRFTSRRARI